MIDIYDFTPQPVYNADYGTSIIVPGGEFDTYPAGNKPYNAPDSEYRSNPATPTQSTSGTSAAASQSSTTSSPSKTRRQRKKPQRRRKT